MHVIAHSREWDRTQRDRWIERCDEVSSEVSRGTELGLTPGGMAAAAAEAQEGTDGVRLHSGAPTQ